VWAARKAVEWERRRADSWVHVLVVCWAGEWAVRKGQRDLKMGFWTEHCWDHSMQVNNMMTKQEGEYSSFIGDRDGKEATVGCAVGVAVGCEEGPTGFIEGCPLGCTLGWTDGREDGSLGAAMQWT
jgi:hypothetical protein